MGRRVDGRRTRRWLRDRDGLARLVGLSSREQAVLLWQAHRRLVRGSVDEAEALYRASLAFWPALTAALLGVGACLQSKGDLVGAEAAYGEVLSIEPANPFALADRAEVRLLAGRTDQAVADLDVAAALPPRVLRRSGLVDRVEALRSIARGRSAEGG